MSACTRLAILAVLLGASPDTSVAQEKPTLSIGSVFASRQGWTIGPAPSGKNCLAAATFAGGTTIWVGFAESGDSLIAFSNPDWKSIDPEKEYVIVIRSGRRNWEGRFRGFERRDEKGVVNVGIKSEFLEDLARAGGISVSVEGASVGRLSMAGSSAALVSMIECQKERRGAPQEARAQPPAEQKRESGGSSGTGFFVSARGHVLTNEHVVRSCSRFMVAVPGEQPRPAKLIARDAQNDLAILTTDVAPAVVPAFNTRPRVGEAIHVYGFPLSGMLATSGNFTLGNVTATAGLRDDTRMLQISAPVQPGNSGGPVIDETGNIVGVLVSKLNALNVAMITDDIPQNVNFSIKAAIAVSFLESNSLAPSMTLASRKLDPPSLAELAKIFTVKITCQ